MKTHFALAIGHPGDPTVIRGSIHHAPGQFLFHLAARLLMGTRWSIIDRSRGSYRCLVDMAREHAQTSQN